MKNKPYVLIADDEPINHEIVKDQLNGFDICTVENGKKCLESIVARRPDLLLLDINMPIMSGFDVILELRDKQQINDFPIIIITATPTQDLLELPEDLRSNDFLIKPFTQQQLHNTIDKYLP